MQQQQINSQTPQQSTTTTKVRRKRDFSQVIDPTANQGIPGQANYGVTNNTQGGYLPTNDLHSGNKSA